MKQEILEMHKKLQAFYKKMMNGWKVGDRYYNTVAKKYAIIISEAWWPEDYPAIRIPLPINPVNPKRGLWGMVDWSKLRYEQWGPDGELAIFKLPYIQYNEDMGIPIKDHPFVVAEPETALLMALLEQEGL